MLKTASLPFALALVGVATQSLRRTPAPEQTEPASVEPTSQRRGNRVLWRLKTELRYWSSALFARVVRGHRLLPLTLDQKAAYLAFCAAPWFDRHWYLATNADVARARLEPIHHLVRHGLREGRPSHREAERLGLAEPVDNRERLTLDSARAPATSVPTDKGHLNLFSDATVQRALARFAKFPLYRDEDYFAVNEPLRREPSLVGHWHALTYGFSEGRQVFRRQTIANELGLRSRVSGSVVMPAEASGAVLPISVAYNQGGNSFLEEIANCLAADLAAAGHDVVVLTERDEPSRARSYNLVVGPHEFFFLGQGRQWLREDILSRSVLYNTEQPQTIWFDRAVPFNMLCQGMIDLTPQLAAIYADSMPALFRTPVGAPLEDRLPDAADPIFRVLPAAARRIGSSTSAMDERSIDVSFFGGISAHRERVFARAAEFFADYQSLIYCRRADTPLRPENGIDLLATARHVGFHSKIVLNIHRDQFGFFEWHRIVRLGMETGAVVVSEPCLPHPELKPNVHYFEESGRHIQNLVEWLLRSPDGRDAYEAVRQNARRYLDDQRASQASGRAIASFMEQTRKVPS